MTDTISWTVYTDSSRAWTMTATHHESGRTWREAGTGARSVARAKILAEIDAWMQAGRDGLASFSPDARANLSPPMDGNGPYLVPDGFAVPKEPRE